MLLVPEPSGMEPVAGSLLHWLRRWTLDLAGCWLTVVGSTVAVGTGVDVAAPVLALVRGCRCWLRCAGTDRCGLVSGCPRRLRDALLGWLLRADST